MKRDAEKADLRPDLVRHAVGLPITVGEPAGRMATPGL